ncbi:MAG: acyl-CoA dehydrogenase family protein, partial [Acidobacteria bacterium]|nr:acyl-CoA dehydrogenase family protein [Acidobacteriota bacterium]
SPVQFLKHVLVEVPQERMLQDYEAWCEAEGRQISDATDRAGTPWLRMFDRFGNRVDEVLFAPEYWKALKKGYQAGVVWRAFEENSLLSCNLLHYLTSFYDPGLCCPYVVSLSTAIPLDKYGDERLKSRFLAQLLRKDARVWQGATWMTEVKGGSDLGAAVETVARAAGDRWLLTGDKYFASNVGAELAVVAARPEGAPRNVRGLALFLLPRQREDGSLNYFVRRLKDKIATRSVPTGEVELRDSEAYLLGQPERGIHLILETLNISRVANSMGSVAVAQRALAEALSFAEQRTAFGKPILEHPLLQKQFEERLSALRTACALAWESAQRLNEVWRETPPDSNRYHLFRLIAHLAKYWTSELAAQTAKWAMEVHGGLGALAEYPAERWFREAMILAIWEGTCHRQILDGLEVMERKGAHRLLLEHLAPWVAPQKRKEFESRVEHHLALPTVEKEATAEELFRDLAVLTAEALSTGLASRGEPR